MEAKLTTGQTLELLVAQMPPEEAKTFESYGHLRRESAYNDCIFIVYQPRGLRYGAKDVSEQKEPKVLSTIKVVSITQDRDKKASLRLLDESTGTEMIVGYMPKKLFGFPIYISLPADMFLMFGGSGSSQNYVQFAVLLKTRNRSSFYSEGNTYVESPRSFRKLFPSTPAEFSF
ncbi:hypothetical protein [Methylotenera sp.]|uniref:hypothetical protein n=1 Tax=Methylotenera sp. TaxID=2051956 RepID=UPI002487D055|nr:hypothetical protein [Methylotenera sp.]MDI1360638.1 hypothetical protein [Methylotenera sp.]